MRLAVRFCAPYRWPSRGDRGRPKKFLKHPIAPLPPVTKSAYAAGANLPLENCLPRVFREARGASPGLVCISPLRFSVRFFPNCSSLTSPQAMSALQWNTSGATLTVRFRSKSHLRIKPLSPPHESSDFSLAAIPHGDEPRRMALFCVFALQRVSVAHGQVAEPIKVVTCCKST